MEISDVILKGATWREVAEGISSFISETKQQPNYNLFVICAAIGIMCDQMIDNFDDEEGENPLYVPRTVLMQHTTDLDYLFQSAVLTSKHFSLSDDDRLLCAFGGEKKLPNTKLSYLHKFSNYGAKKLLEKISEEPIETMENLRIFVETCLNGINVDIDEITDDEFEDVLGDIPLDDILNID